MDGYGSIGKYIKKYSKLELTDKPSKYGLILGYPTGIDELPVEKVFVITAWESTGLPDFFI